MAVKTDLIREMLEELRRSAGLSRRNAALSANALVAALTRLLSKGEPVELRGLGTFSVSRVAARKTAFRREGGEVVPAVIPSHGRIVFRPAKKLREAVWDAPPGTKKPKPGTAETD